MKITTLCAECHIAEDIGDTINMYTPKTREEYIAQCRYYKGGDYETLPKEDQSMGFYEQCRVDAHYSEFSCY